MEKPTSKKDNNLTFSNSMWLFVRNLDNAEIDVQNDEQHSDIDDQQVGDELQVLIDNAEEEHDMIYDYYLGDTIELPHVLTKRSNRVRKPFFGYLVNGREPKCFEEALKSEKKTNGRM